MGLYFRTSTCSVGRLKHKSRCSNSPTYNHRRTQSLSTFRSSSLSTNSDDDCSHFECESSNLTVEVGGQHYKICTESADSFQYDFHKLELTKSLSPKTLLCLRVLLLEQLAEQDSHFLTLKNQAMDEYQQAQFQWLQREP